MSGFEWLVHEHAGETALNSGSRVVLDDERWSGTVERVVVSPSLHVALNNVRPRRDFGIQPVEDYLGDHIVGQVMLEGGVDLDFRNGEVAIAAGNHSLLYRLPGEFPTYSFKAGVPFQSAAYGITLARIERLFDGEIPGVLMPLLEPGVREPRHVASDSSGLIRNVASTLFASGLNGPLRRMMMEGATLQLLALQAAAAMQQVPARRRVTLSTRERLAVHEARERLLAEMRNPPSLGELADAVSLGEKRLGAGFRLEFGATAFEILRAHRLEHARQALEAGGIALKEVAYRVGYNHVSNFIHAYRARFGAPPRRHLRRDEED